MNKSVCKKCVNQHMYQKWGWRDEWRWFVYEEARCKAWYQFGNDDRIISGEDIPRHCFYPVEQAVLNQSLVETLRMKVIDSMGQKFSWRQWLAKVLI